MAKKSVGKELLRDGEKVQLKDDENRNAFSADGGMFCERRWKHCLC